jgi:hypothetical protein
VLTPWQAIYKTRGEEDPEPGAFQQKPKRLRFVMDVSARYFLEVSSFSPLVRSMYRYNGGDGRLDRMLECVKMIIEAFQVCSSCSFICSLLYLRPRHLTDALVGLRTQVFVLHCRAQRRRSRGTPSLRSPWSSFLCASNLCCRSPLWTMASRLVP